MSQDTLNGSVTEISDFGKQMWAYLTGSEAVIDYSFVDMKVGVPKTTGPNSEVAYWTLSGTLRITTTDKHHSGASSANGS
jgi:hypothetical protein